MIGNAWKYSWLRFEICASVFKNFLYELHACIETQTKKKKIIVNVISLSQVISSILSNYHPMPSLLTSSL